MKDVTIIALDDDEVDADDAQDEFAGILRPAVQANVLGSTACITRIWHTQQTRDMHPCRIGLALRDYRSSFGEGYEVPEGVLWAV